MLWGCFADKRDCVVATSPLGVSPQTLPVTNRSPRPPTMAPRLHWAVSSNPPPSGIAYEDTRRNENMDPFCISPNKIHSRVLQGSHADPSTCPSSRPSHPPGPKPLCLLPSPMAPGASDGIGDKTTRGPDPDRPEDCNHQRKDLQGTQGKGGGRAGS